MKKIFEKWLLSFDNKDETGMDYKKLTAFWFVGVISWLLFSYTVKQVKVWWWGLQVVFNETLEDFRWILGLCLAFVLVLTYFTNSKSLTEFITKWKKNEDSDKIPPV